MQVQPEIRKVDWGELKIILSRKYEKGGSIETGIFRCDAGKSLPYHTHEGADEFCWVFEGAGTFVIGGKEFEVKSGELIKIPKDVEHRSFPKGKSHFTSFFIVCP